MGANNTKILNGRASAVLTTSEVAAASFDLSNAKDGNVDVALDFTKGSLTNVIFKIYVSSDGSTWYELRGPDGSTVTQTLTADAQLVVPCKAPGHRFLRASVQGTGTVTSSLAAINYKYQPRWSA